MEPESGPVVPASSTLPEITVKAVVLSVILAAVLDAANAYLGLFAGMTVSASIPAAVASMAILRLFRRSNILENNIVQTAASSGEALAAGVIFTIPALLMIGYWTQFAYWQTTALALVGGLLGVLFTIPLRRALILGTDLRFPEGVATAEVLKAGSARPPDGWATAEGATAKGLRTLLTATAIGGAVKLGESGCRLWAEAFEGALSLGRTVIYGGINLSPALLGVGFIIGLNTATVVFLGGVLSWLVILPTYCQFSGVPEGLTGIEAAKAVWRDKIRFVGIGAMLVGGLWTLIQIREPVLLSLCRLGDVYRQKGAQANDVSLSLLPRTERDASPTWILCLLGLSLLPMALLYYGVVGSVGVALLMTVEMSVAAFLFSSVAAYMAGLVGSSSNPVSGVTIATIMLAALTLVTVMGSVHPAGPAAALLIGAVVCCAAAMGGDNLQDLKTGHLVGATPWKQQVMQIIGVATGAVVIVPVLALLHTKYGIGAATPEHPHPLSAPQATLMASLAQGVFGAGLPWRFVGAGVVIGVLCILLDRRQAASGASLRLPVLGVALGIYLPFKLSAAIFAGGLIAEAVGRPLQAPRHGLLCAAGLVTGEALMGIGLALPIAVSSFWPAVNSDPFALFEQPPLGAWPGVIIVGAVAAWLYRTARTPIPEGGKSRAR
jgi:putative OPT family oligopeptide transporter